MSTCHTGLRFLRFDNSSLASIMNDLLRELHQDRLMRSLAAEAAPPAGGKKKRSRADDQVDAASSSKRQRNKSSSKQADQKGSVANEVIDLCDDEPTAAPQKSNHDGQAAEQCDFLLAQQLQAQFDAENNSQAAHAAEQKAAAAVMTQMPVVAHRGAIAPSAHLVQNAFVAKGLPINIGYVTEACIVS
jgi:hypothetical protein